MPFVVDDVVIDGMERGERLSGSGSLNININELHFAAVERF